MEKKKNCKTVKLSTQERLRNLERTVNQMCCDIAFLTIVIDDIADVLTKNESVKLDIVKLNADVKEKLVKLENDFNNKVEDE